MMAWRYCGKCQEGMPAPTLREAVLESQECRHCGHEFKPGKEDLLNALESIEDRIEQAENRIHELEVSRWA